ncbi:PSD1 and planctomycete cytochrome C domain-containing protein [Neorhodopirellula pilleata]|uniref:Planctomycete cytochrome C n=1 Tax=Neorhodopirellula pilleata TaxID=2714738 RepID=A0A5C6A2G3_9BACT|nr:PSD1 and planctomycete cytochrome C domain-containing protein [Neorhodopirellula pilleata]TWT93595.1 Planctomycete cytochrome C [Neorhodopirellula pilleata]
MTRVGCCLLFGVVYLTSVLPASEPAFAEKVSYSQQVRPILSDKCFACHGPDEQTREAGLRLDTESGMLADLGGYVAFKPGDADDSEAMRRILASDPDMHMPPEESHKDLTPKEIEVLRRWINEGAAFEMHWAYRPLQRPEVSPPQSSATAALSLPIDALPIDALIEAKWSEHGITPVDQASPVTLVRRLYLDLLGVPPTPDDVDEFLNDPATDAYPRLVNRLLDDPRFGERMAVYWLDLVRYADTIGYHSDNPREVSAYRDYVIGAFNSNLPFDRFTTEQLAGDLLPDPTTDQLIASGYNRLLQTTQEGGSQAKEYIAIYAADRVRNVSSVWLGSTVGCAQCHDHKYDPITAKDFYSMAAFFADIKETPVGSQPPNLKLYTDAQRQQLAAIDRELQQLEAGLKPDATSELAAQIAAEQRQWEATQRDPPEDSSPWKIANVDSATATAEATLTVQPDGSLLHTGAQPNQTDYQITVQASGTVRAIRLEALTDDSFAKQGGLSRANGNFVLTDFTVSRNGKSLPFGSATADFEQASFPVMAAIDDDPESGWAVSGHSEKAARRTAVFTLKEPLELGPEPHELKLEMRHRSKYAKHSIGRLRLALTDREDAGVVDPDVTPQEILAIIRIDTDQRDESQRKQLADYYRNHSPTWKAAQAKLETARKRRDAIEDSVRTTLITERLPQPRTTRILPRGNWLDESGEIVQPAMPDFLTTGEPKSEPLTRLQLAEWLADPNNPLTARTFVNRLWSLYFGRGLSRNLDDLGGQGQPPTHPELLDWLAMEFIESGWDVKHMIRLILNSDTYRRSSVPDAELKRSDPGNDWFARQGRWRLDAEFVRDTSLQLSGLLVDETIGGTSVKPYQPAGYWQHLNFPTREWQADKDERLYRRSLYTFWCRSFLHPSMLAFDAPSREECTAERARSNIPQQALVVLNDPIFVEAARVFAQRVMRQTGDEADRIEWVCQQAWSRFPTQAETELLTHLLSEQLRHYADDPAAAKQLLSVGEAAVPEDLTANDEVTGELAAWTQVTRAILNAYETISRY